MTEGGKVLKRAGGCLIRVGPVFERIGQGGVEAVEIGIRGAHRAYGAYGGRVADSYELALQTVEHPESKVFVESAVHFMAESIAILAAPAQDVWITNPKSGCTLELLAKDHII